MTVRYLAYGSNMDPRRMAEVCPGARAVGHGRLEGYRLELSARARRWEGGAVNLVPEPGSHVWGVVWELGEEDLRALDRVAGAPDHFTRQRVKVEVRGPPGGRDPAELVDCEVFLMPEPAGLVEPTESYVAAVRAAMRIQGLPPKAIDAFDRAVEAAGGGRAFRHP